MKLTVRVFHHPQRCIISPKTLPLLQLLRLLASPLLLACKADSHTGLELRTALLRARRLAPVHPAAILIRHIRITNNIVHPSSTRIVLTREQMGVITDINPPQEPQLRANLLLHLPHQDREMDIRSLRTSSPLRLLLALHLTRLIITCHLLPANSAVLGVIMSQTGFILAALDASYPSTAWGLVKEY